MSQIKLPNLGDGIDSATVVSVLVSVGDSIEKEQTIMELETDKAVAPLPASEAGVVKSILVKEGDVINTGQGVLELGGNGSAPATSEAPAAAPATTPAPVPVPVPAQPVAAAIPQTTFQPGVYQSPSGAPIPAAPSVRKMARLFGIDLTRIPGSGHGGRITHDDVKNYFAYLQSLAASGATPMQSAISPSPAQQKPKKPSIDFSKWGPVEEKPLTSLRMKIASNLQETWQTIPHVTQFDDADVTDLMALRKKYNSKYEKKKAKLTLTVLALKAVVEALKQFPLFNASFDEEKKVVVYKNYYHIGVAVDTENGLIVPVIKDVDKKTLKDLAIELNELAEKARNRTLSMDELKGGTFTISNLGGLGGKHFTPIINAPEVAILALSRGSKVPVYNGDKLEPKIMMPMGISYDHRLIDGADGARFMVAMVTAFEKFNESLLKELK